MKSCAVCGRTFPDEYSFCLTDGTVLQPMPDEEATVVAERPAAKRSGRRRSILIFVLAGLLSLSLGATAAVLYFFWPRQNSGNDQVVVDPTPVASATPSPKPSRTPSPEPTPTPTETNNKENVSPEPPLPPAAQGAATRITFRRGRTYETVSGSVIDNRSFVLSARSNQHLHAKVASPGDCVNFASGDAEVDYGTVSGSNYLTVLNSCDDPSPFTLTVSIK